MKTFLISDTHFCHNNCYKFTVDGELMRPWASNSEEGDQIMVDNWNRVVGQGDKVYHLGDVAIGRKGLDILGRLNGRKILIKGNHDIFKAKDYLEYFKDIRGSHKLFKFILTHFPVHPDSIAGWCKANIHGHIHARKVLLDSKPDLRYFNVSVEQINQTPIDFEEILEKYRDEQKD